MAVGGGPCLCLQHPEIISVRGAAQLTLFECVVCFIPFIRNYQIRVGRKTFYLIAIFISTFCYKFNAWGPELIRNRIELSCFLDNAVMLFTFREAASGINRVSYFVAVNVAQIPIILITPIVYLSLLYPLVAPRGNINSHLVIVRPVKNGQSRVTCHYTC